MRSFPLIPASVLGMALLLYPAVQASDESPLSPDAMPPPSANPSMNEGPASQKKEMPAPVDLFKDGKKRLIIRVDDIGFCHGANMALKRIAESGKVTAASVLVNTPWLDEAVDILKEHPEISVGVHTCLNSEWVPYKWGPVLPARDVPSLVDEWGKFFGTRALLVAHHPNPNEAEKEIRAQIDFALRKGLKISYLDHHMSAAVTTPELKDRFVKIARDYNLPISRWCGEVQGPVIYSTPPEKKTEALLDGLRKLEAPGTYLVVIHPGTNDPEMQALRDLNANGLPNMPAHREAEASALCSPELRTVLAEKQIQLVGYDTFKEKFPGLWIDPDEQP